MYLAAVNISNSTTEYLNFDGITLNLESNITGKVLANLNGIAYFNKLSTGSLGNELWQYDGVTSPTVVADINPGTASSNPSNVTVYNNKIYFVADDGTNGPEVWNYDGNTANLTGLITPSVLNPNIAFMKVYNNKLYFNANNGIGTGESGSELWVIDAPLSLNNYEKVSATLYPIPIGKELNIFSEKEFDEINLFDSRGSEIFSEHFSPLKNKQIYIELPKGFYTIMLKIKGKTIYNKKVIK
jgi:ELWxxDGT repeat protein